MDTGFHVKSGIARSYGKFVFTFKETAELISKLATPSYIAVNIHGISKESKGQRF